jgi:hypothetical protein
MMWVPYPLQKDIQNVVGKIVSLVTSNSLLVKLFRPVARPVRSEM